MGEFKGITLRQYWMWTRAFLKTLPYKYRNFIRERNWNFAGAREKGKFLEAQAEAALTRQDRCTHRKGGYAEAFKHGGDSHMYAVIKHMFANGDVWVNCLRCSKRWKPGDVGYAEALKFPTQNMTSSSIQFAIHKQIGKHRVDVTKEVFREAMKNS